MLRTALLGAALTLPLLAVDAVVLSAPAEAQTVTRRVCKMVPGPTRVVRRQICDNRGCRVVVTRRAGPPVQQCTVRRVVR